MAINKSKKAELIAKYSEILKDSQTVVYVKFKTFPVSKQDILRKTGIKENINYMVVKKTLWNIACEANNIKGDKIMGDAEMSVLYSAQDNMSPIKLAYNTQKDNKESFNIFGGIFEREYKDKDFMISMATIPSREVLLSQIAFLFKSPIQRFAIAINEVSKIK